MPVVRGVSYGPANIGSRTYAELLLNGTENEKQKKQKCPHIFLNAETFASARLRDRVCSIRHLTTT